MLLLLPIASVCDEVWVLDGNGYLVKNQQETLHFSSAPITKCLDEEDVDWELLG
jgi:hypothetical protein